MQKIISCSTTVIPIPFIVVTRTTAITATLASAQARAARRTPRRFRGTEPQEGTRHVALRSSAQVPVPAEPWTTPRSMTLETH